MRNLVHIPFKKKYVERCLFLSTYFYFVTWDINSNYLLKILLQFDIDRLLKYYQE